MIFDTKDDPFDPNDGHYGWFVLVKDGTATTIMMPYGKISRKYSFEKWEDAETERLKHGEHAHTIKDGDNG